MKRFKVISLAELCECLSKGEEPARGSVAVTFDDGWLDNYEHALPVLRRVGVPATVFLPTAYIGTDRMFWTDEVGLAVTEAKRTPNTFAQLKDSLSAEELAKEGGEDLLSAARSIASISDIDHLVEYLKRAVPSVRNATLDVLRMLRRSGATTPPARSFMSWSEVEEMSTAGIAFGSHSHEHQNLTELDESALESDIRRSYQLLDQHGIGGTPPFCFPGGYYNLLCLKALEEAGVEVAVTTGRASALTGRPRLLGRTLLHEDISGTPALFLARIAGRPF